MSMVMDDNKKGLTLELAVANNNKLRFEIHRDSDDCHVARGPPIV